MKAKLALKSEPTHQTIVRVGDRAIGGTDLLIVGGPCSVESREQMVSIASSLSPYLSALRGGVYKPRTSPYDFQGLGTEGLQILADVREQFGLPVITEVMAIEQIAQVSEVADVLQVGSRNMQNYDLLKALGAVNKPILLKRGLAATIAEFLMAAEYILSHGNPNVILCERGIRSFDPYTRNVLDLGAVVVLKQLTHLPVLVDPSHAAGKRELVPHLARAAVAAGADGVMIECHPEPEQSISDAEQALSIEEMIAVSHSLRSIALSIKLSTQSPKVDSTDWLRNAWLTAC